MAAHFATSAYGRFGHLVMALAFGAPTTLVVGGLILRVVSLDNFALWLGAVAFAGTSALVTLYCIAFALKGGPRIVCSNEQLTYIGLLRTATIPWSSITEWWLSFGGRSPFVHLVLRARPVRWWPYYLNISGLTPSYVTLVALVREKTPHATVWLPRRYEIIEAHSAVPLAVRETAVDDALTIVRTDAQKPARRST